MPSEGEEKEAIRDVLAEYCFRIDDDRFEEFAALFAEDGTWETAFGSRGFGRQLYRRDKAGRAWFFRHRKIDRYVRGDQ